MSLSVRRPFGCCVSHNFIKKAGSFSSMLLSDLILCWMFRTGLLSPDIKSRSEILMSKARPEIAFCPSIRAYVRNVLVYSFCCFWLDVQLIILNSEFLFCLSLREHFVSHITSMQYVKNSKHSDFKFISISINALIYSLLLPWLNRLLYREKLRGGRENKWSKCRRSMICSILC